MTETSLITAFLVGLLGGVHCVGMCGGIVGALTMTLPAPHRQAPLRLLPFMLAYNTGRLVSYGLAGALVGGVGYVARHLPALFHAQTVLAVIAAQPLGRLIQKHLTTSAELEGVRIVSVESMGRRFPRLHKVRTAPSQG